MAWDDLFYDFPAAGYSITAARLNAIIAKIKTIFTGSPHYYLRINAAGDDLELVPGTAGSGDVSTDVIWDAKGDLVVGTGADAAVRLPVGADGKVLTVVSGTPSWEAATAPTELTLADGKSVKVYKALGTDLTTSGITVTLTAHENVAFGNVCFINSDGEAAKADSDAAATMPVVVMATATINADAAGVFLPIGTARDDSWNWTPGASIYASGTAGGLTTTAPTGTGKCVQIVGRALTADSMFFAPDNTWLELS